MLMNGIQTNGSCLTLLLCGIMLTLITRTAFPQQTPQSPPPSAAIVTDGGSILKKPVGRVILTVKGAITHTNGVGVDNQPVANFDREMLESLPQKSIRTSTRWSDSVSEYEGVLLNELLHYLGAKGDTIEAVALDNYKSPLTSVEDFARYSVIVAIKKDGKYIRIRDKGPTRLIYPIDDYPELKKDLLTQYRLIWHLRYIIVE